MTPIVVTPVKNSLDTVKKTLRSVTDSSIPIDYYVFNDFSEQDTEDYLRSYADELSFNLVNLSDHVTTASPNYRTVLIMSQKMALEAGSPLIIVESDVIVEPHTLQSLIQLQNQKQEAGMVAAVTTNQQGEINFPYSHISPTAPDIIKTKRSLSFCCTLLSNQLLASFDFNELNEDKDWYDVHISKKSRTLGFENFLVKSLPVIHLPHSSRPWKMEKYKNPFSYYLKKYFLKRDRI